MGARDELPTEGSDTGVTATATATAQATAIAGAGADAAVEEEEGEQRVRQRKAFASKLVSVTGQKVLFSTSSGLRYFNMDHVTQGRVAQEGITRWDKAAVSPPPPPPPPVAVYVESACPSVRDFLAGRSSCLFV